eukprot:2583229-Prymnesium_polylepis.2
MPRAAACAGGTRRRASSPARARQRAIRLGRQRRLRRRAAGTAPERHPPSSRRVCPWQAWAPVHAALCATAGVR